MIVVDASLILAATTGKTPEDADWAMALLYAQRSLAPAHMWAETANALRHLERRGEIDTTEAGLSHASVLELAIAPVPYQLCAERIWELRNNLTAYDAWYVAAAELAQAPLATLDRRLARASGPACEFLLPP